jgi:hypothetical protein
MALAGFGTVLALGLAACSMPVKILEAEIPPEQYQDMNCDGLNRESRPRHTATLKYRCSARSRVHAAEWEALRHRQGSVRQELPAHRWRLAFIGCAVACNCQARGDQTSVDEMKLFAYEPSALSQLL